MREKEIIEQLNTSLNQANTDLLVKIKNEEHRPMKNHDWITQQHLPQKNERAWFRPLLSFGLSLVALVFVYVGFNQLSKPVGPLVDSLVYVDVNPSLLIKVDKDEKVIEIVSQKSSDKAIIDALGDVKSKTIDDVMQLLIHELVNQGYLNEKMPTVLVSVMNGNQDIANRQMKAIDRIIEGYFSESETNPLIVNQRFERTSDDIVKQAETLQISESKLMFVKRVHELIPSLNIEELAKMSMNEMIELLLDSEVDLDSIDSRLNSIRLDREQNKEPEIPIIDDEDIIEIPIVDDDDIDGDDDIDDNDDDTEVIEKPQPNLPTTPMYLSLQSARNMVTNRFGGVIQKIEYHYDDNNPLYKGEALKEGFKVVFELNARTKTWGKWSVDDDSQYTEYGSRYRSSNLMDQAVNSVISRSGQSTTFIQKIEFDWDETKPMFKGEAFYLDTKIVFEMDATNLSFEKFDVSTGDSTYQIQYRYVRSR